MEIKPARAKSYVSKPDPGVQVFLLFGPDEGLIREWSEALQIQIVDDPADPFRLADLDGVNVNSEPSRLYDEAGAMSFGGGQRVVKVRRLSGKINDAILDFIKEPIGDARVLMEAPGASKQNAIVKAAISSKTAAAIPCYHDETRSLKDVVAESLARSGLRPGRGVVEFIVNHAGSDRSLTRREIDKLAIYMGATDPEAPVAVELEHVQAVVGDTALLTIDSLVDATFDGRLNDLERTLQRVRREGTAPSSILRAMYSYATRLVRVQGYVRSGMDTKKAAARLRPPVHFSRMDRFTRHAQLSPKILDTIMSRLAAAERDTRSTGLPDETICSRALSGIAVAVKRR